MRHAAPRISLCPNDQYPVVIRRKTLDRLDGNAFFSGRIHQKALPTANRIEPADRQPSPRIGRQGQRERFAEIGIRKEEVIPRKDTDAAVLFPLRRKRRTGLRC